MTAPTPAIPSFVDGMVVHQGDLNALAANLTNLYAYNQGGFRTQRPAVLVRQTTPQPVPNTTDTVANFQSEVIDTNNMWVSSVPGQITIQTPGIYFVFAQTRFPNPGGATLGTIASGTLFANGQGNRIGGSDGPFMSAGSGPKLFCGVLQSFAAGAILGLNLWQSSGGTVNTATDFGSTFLGAVFLTPSS